MRKRCSKPVPQTTSIDQLHLSFVDVLKSGNQELLSQFCMELQPNDAILSYMKENHFSYRGIPEDSDNNDSSNTHSAESYCNPLLEFQQMLKENGSPGNIKMGQLNLKDSIIINKRLEIASTEIQFRLSTENQIFNCTLGELLKIQGQWYAFHKPTFK
jgi:hypothetical protein